MNQHTLDFNHSLSIILLGSGANLTFRDLILAGLATSRDVNPQLLAATPRVLGSPAWPTVAQASGSVVSCTSCTVARLCINAAVQKGASLQTFL